MNDWRSFKRDISLQSTSLIRTTSLLTILADLIPQRQQLLEVSFCAVVARAEILANLVYAKEIKLEPLNGLCTRIGRIDDGTKKLFEGASLFTLQLLICKTCLY